MQDTWHCGAVLPTVQRSILLPEEHDYDEAGTDRRYHGEHENAVKKNYIIINAEGVGDSINMAKRIEDSNRHRDKSNHPGTHAAWWKPDM